MALSALQYYRDGMDRSAAHNLARSEKRRERQIEARARMLVDENVSGLFWTIDERGYAAVPSILDYPKRWTPDRIAQRRQQAARLVAVINRSPELLDWVQHYWGIREASKRAQWEGRDKMKAAFAIIGLDLID